MQEMIQSKQTLLWTMHDLTAQLRTGRNGEWCVMGKRYDVALYPPGGANFPAYVDDCIEADSPLDAVLWLMEQHDLARVIYAAVGEVNEREQRCGVVVYFERGVVTRSKTK